MSVDAYLTHIVSRMRNDVDFLLSQGALSPNDARIITDKLPATDASSVISTSSIVPHRGTPNGPPMRNAVPPPPGPPSQLQAKALWAYNENGQETDDLSFSAGDIIYILEETNADWWKGRNSRGEVGLFPANYVEKLRAEPHSMPILPPLPGRMVAPIPQVKSEYSHAVVPMPPPEVQVATQEHPKKKSKFGKLGNTMANSAAGGVGFGAGAAIGSGIVNSIF